MASLNLKHGVGDKGDPRRDVPSPETAGDVLKRLDRYERTHGRSGAIPRASKQMMLQEMAERGQAAAGEDRHIRGVNIGSTDKAMNAMLLGYETVRDEKGDPIVRGNIQVMSCPREVYEEREEDRRELTASRLGYDDESRRRDSPEFYQEAERIAEMAKSKGHSSGRTVKRIVKDDLPTSVGE